MLPINKKLKLIGMGLAVSIFLGVTAKFIFATLPATWDITKNPDNFFYTIFYKSQQEPPQNLVVIDSGDAEESRNRSEYAAMIRQLVAAGARCIALDIRFLGQNDLDRAGDQELVMAVEESPRVILAIDFSGYTMPDDLQLINLERMAIPDETCQDHSSVFKLPGVDLPFEDLLAAARSTGHINFIHNEYYHFPLVIRFNQKCYPSLPVAIAKLYLEAGSNDLLANAAPGNADIQALQPTRNRLTLKDIPIDGDEQLLVRFIPMSKLRPHIRSWDGALNLLQNHQQQFRDKIVLIVNSSAETMIPTPLGPYHRWAVFASVTSQLLQHKYIEASVLFYPTLFSAIVIFFSLIWFLFVTPRLDPKWRKTRMLFLTGNVIFFFIIFVLFRIGDQWIGVVIPLLMFNASMLVVRHEYYGMIKSPRYVDFGVAVLERRGKKYPVQVYQSDLGEDTSDIFFNSFVEEDIFINVLKRVQEWQASREDVRWIGDMLFRAIFQGEVYLLLVKVLERARAENSYVRLKLRIDAPELLRLPWELMRSTELDSLYLALHRRISLVRYLPLHRSATTLKNRIPLNILVFIAEAPDLNTDEEKEHIMQELRWLRWSGDVRLRICENATLESLSAELERKPDIFHYIGHANFDTEQEQAYLEFQAGVKVFAQTLRFLFQESSVKLAVLNSCKTSDAAETDAFTGMAQNLVKVGVPAVIAMQFKIPDETAVHFSQVFYSKLLEENSIDAAMSEARKRIVEKTALDQQHWATPVLFMRKYDGILFDQTKFIKGGQSLC